MLFITPFVSRKPNEKTNRSGIDITTHPFSRTGAARSFIGAGMHCLSLWPVCRYSQEDSEYKNMSLLYMCNTLTNLRSCNLAKKCQPRSHMNDRDKIQTHNPRIIPIVTPKTINIMRHNAHVKQNPPLTKGGGYHPRAFPCHPQRKMT